MDLYGGGKENKKEKERKRNGEGGRALYIYIYSLNIYNCIYMFMLYLIQYIYYILYIFIYLHNIYICTYILLDIIIILLYNYYILLFNTLFRPTLYGYTCIRIAENIFIFSSFGHFKMLYPYFCFL